MPGRRLIGRRAGGRPAARRRRRRSMADRGPGGRERSRGGSTVRRPASPSPRTELRTSHPARAGLDPAPLDAAWRAVEGYTRPQADRASRSTPAPCSPTGTAGRVVLTRATG